MDSLPTLDEAARRSKSTEPQGGKARLFSAPEDPRHAFHISSKKDLRLPRKGLNGASVLLVATALVGSAIAGVLFYGYSGGNWSKRPVSVTTRIPDAKAVGAAVQNLPPPDLVKPVTPEEAVKENSDRPFVSRMDTPAARFVLKADGADRERAVTCLTQAIYYEAASEGMDGGRAVAQVILNRVRHPGFPASVCGVVYQGSDRSTGCQFTFTCDGSLLRPHVQSLWTRSQKIAKDALSGHVFAPVGHATHYHADYVLPYWADSLDKSIQIGRHIFYRLRGSVGDNRSFFQRYAGFEPPIPDPRPSILNAPSTTEAEQQQQLAKVLLGEDSKGVANEGAKVPVPTSPLLVDAVRPALIADGNASRSISSRHPKPSIDCPTNTDQKQLTPLGADDLRSGVARPGC